MVSKILLVSFTLCSTSAFVTLFFQLTGSILLQILSSQASSLFLSAVDNVRVSQLHVRLWRIQQQTLVVLRINEMRWFAELLCVCVSAGRTAVKRSQNGGLAADTRHGGVSENWARCVQPVYVSWWHTHTLTHTGVLPDIFSLPSIRQYLSNNDCL